jgi:hypothetical protein
MEDFDREVGIDLANDLSRVPVCQMGISVEKDSDVAVRVYDGLVA